MLQSNSYQVSFAAFNSFFLTWMKSGFFTRRRLYVWLGMSVVLAVATLWQAHRSVAGILVKTSSVTGAPGILIEFLAFIFLVVFYLLFSGIFLYVLSAVLTYVSQTLVFASGSNRRRLQSVAISEQGMVKHVDGVIHSAPWAAISDIVDARHAILFFTGRNSTTIVPKTAFASDADAAEFFTQANSFCQRAAGRDGQPGQVDS